MSLKQGSSYRFSMKVENWTPEALEATGRPQEYTNVTPVVVVVVAAEAHLPISGFTAARLALTPASQRLEINDQECSFRFRVPMQLLGPHKVKIACYITGEAGGLSAQTPVHEEILDVA